MHGTNSDQKDTVYTKTGKAILVSSQCILLIYFQSTDDTGGVAATQKRAKYVSCLAAVDQQEIGLCTVH